MLYQDFDFSTVGNLTYYLYLIFLILTIVLSIVGIIYVLYLLKSIRRLDSGSPEMLRVHDAISEGSKTFLKRQYKTVAIVLLIIFVLFIFISLDIAISFLIGAISSIVASYISMLVSTIANVRVAQACKTSAQKALKIGFNSGMVIGSSVISTSLLAITILYVLYNFTVANIVGFGFGASFAALFAQLGGGIFTKGADIGADIVGKLETGLAEDDVRNPATIADNVGDMVGDCAGRGADLFESSSANNLGAMIIGVTLSAVTANPFFIIFSLISRALGNIAGILGGLFIKSESKNGDDFNPIKEFGRALIATALICIGFFFLLSLISFGGAWWVLFLCAVIGILLALSSYLIVDYYTSAHYRPVKDVIKASESSAATNVISGFALGLESTVLPIVSFVICILLCFFLGEYYGLLIGVGDLFKAGVFGVTVATMGLLAMTSLILAFDGFGPVADNAAGIAEMAHLGNEVRDNLDRLDSAGNTTKALAKGFGMTCAALSAIILYVAYLEETHSSDVNIYHPIIMCTLLIGGVTPFLFSALAIRGAGISADAIVREIKKQFKLNPDIVKGTATPDYTTPIDISTKVALKQMIAPAFLAVGMPLLVGLLFGPIAIAAFLISGTVSGLLLGFVMNTGGGALDNAKKAIEGGLLGGKGSEAHAASIIGDTFGDPLKDTAGPSLHIFIKVINTVSITFGPLFLIFGGLIAF